MVAAKRKAAVSKHTKRYLWPDLKHDAAYNRLFLPGDHFLVTTGQRKEKLMSIINTFGGVAAAAARMAASDVNGVLLTSIVGSSTFTLNTSHKGLKPGWPGIFESTSN